MTVFVAASDETYDGTTTGHFLLGGWVARETLWTRSFTPRWQQRVLKGPPKVDYLHMVDIKSPAWRDRHCITHADAERRLDAAFELIADAHGLFPIAFRLDGGHMRAQFANVKLHIRTPGGVARRDWEPDYLCFLHFALTAVAYVHETQPDAEKVDFLVENNGATTRYLSRFRESMAHTLAKLGAEHLAQLVGRLIPGDKHRVPLQAADILCWYTQASDAGRLSDNDARRYAKITSRRGYLEDFTKEKISEFAQRAYSAAMDDHDPDF